MSSKPKRFSRGLLALTSGAALVLASVGLAAPAQSLAGGITATFAPQQASAAVGSPIIVNMSLQQAIPGTSTTSVTVTPVGSNSGAAPAISLPNAVVNGITQFKFVPPHVGFWTFQASGVDSNSTNPNFTANPVPVAVQMQAPNTVRVGTPVQISATVVAQGGSQLAPVGQIQFATVGGGNLGAPVFLSQNNPSTASISWTPANVGQVQFTATYIPNTINGFPDTNCPNNCVSQVDTVQVTDSGVNVFLTNPPQFFVGVPNAITAVISARPSAGTVVFTVNGQAIGGRVSVDGNNQATISWTPGAAGTYTVAANWTGNSGVTGGSTETVNVGAAPPQQDNIVLTQAGGPTWVPGNSYQIANGTTVSFSATSSSGAAVTLSDTGPCTIAGLSISAAQGNGGCILTASTPGGNGYAPGSKQYTIVLVPGTQAPRVQPPTSGRIKLGKRFTLEGPGNNDTNAGQNMSWRVTSGRANCRLLFPANGAVRLRAESVGRCNVRAVAPAVPGQWNRLVLNRTFNVRR
jgi:hypothetical protein